MRAPNLEDGFLILALLQEIVNFVIEFNEMVNYFDPHCQLMLYYFYSFYRGIIDVISMFVIAYAWKHYLK